MVSSSLGRAYSDKKINKFRESGNGMAVGSDKIIKFSEGDLKKAVEAANFSAGCEVINSDIARDPKFEANIRERLSSVGNNCFGDISAALDESDEVSEFSLSLVSAYFKREPA